jgi:hypothetical protein
MKSWLYKQLDLSLTDGITFPEPFVYMRCGCWEMQKSCKDWDYRFEPPRFSHDMLSPSFGGPPGGPPGPGNMVTVLS